MDKEGREARTAKQMREARGNGMGSARAADQDPPAGTEQHVYRARH